MTYCLIKKDTKSYTKLCENLTEAAMDGAVVRLKDCSGEIGIIGLATCYGFIIKNKFDSAVLHVSPLCFNTEEMVSETMMDFNLEYPNEEIEVILVRSYRSYRKEQAITIAHYERIGEPCDDEKTPAEEYFKDKDNEYMDYFRNEFNIIPQFIEIPHHFFIINRRNKLCFFNEYVDDELLFIRNDVLDNSNSFSNGKGTTENLSLNRYGWLYSGDSEEEPTPKKGKKNNNLLGI